MTRTEDPDREIARTLRLRAEPPRVARLSRRALALLAGVAAAAVASVVGWSLSGHGRGAAPPPVPTPAAVAPAQAVAELPKDYASLPPGVPKLGPPLPGDLGRPLLEARSEGAAAGDDAGAAQARVDPAVEQARMEAQQARRSGLAAAGARPAGRVVAETPAAALPATPVRDAGAGLRTPSSPYLLQAGAVIRAALITGVRSDLPGQVTAQVTEDVFDSVSGRWKLIPQGSRLIGTYDSHPAFGQGRLLLSWTRLILPDGRSVALDREPSADAQGYAGVEDRVDRHWRRLIGASLVSSLLGAGAVLGSGTSDNSLLQALRTGAASAANQAGQQLVGKTLDAAPSLSIRPGYPVRVVVTKDLALEPWVS